MTVRATRTFEFDVPPERVWALIADPGKRAEAVSVVDSYDLHEDDATRATWHLSLPIPMVDRTIAVETRDLTRDEPRYVKFEGRSKVMNVIGEHEITETDGGSRIENRFIVESSIPGVERYFRSHLDDELENLNVSLTAALEGDDA